MNYDIKRSGERIRQLRMKQGYTQEETAELLNMDRSYYSRIESGKRGCSVDMLVHLSELLGVSLDYLVLGKDLCNAVATMDKAQLKEDIITLLLRQLNNRNQSSLYFVRAGWSKYAFTWSGSPDKRPIKAEVLSSNSWMSWTMAWEPTLCFRSLLRYSSGLYSGE